LTNRLQSFAPKIGNGRSQRIANCSSIKTVMGKELRLRFTSLPMAHSPHRIDPTSADFSKWTMPLVTGPIIYPSFPLLSVSRPIFAN
jgi:hypothetical protein